MEIQASEDEDERVSPTRRPIRSTPKNSPASSRCKHFQAKTGLSHVFSIFFRAERLEDAALILQYIIKV